MRRLGQLDMRNGFESFTTLLLQRVNAAKGKGVKHVS